MVQKYFIESWLLPCSLRSHRIANPTPKNRLRHFSALPTHHPTSGWDNEILLLINRYLSSADRAKRKMTVQKTFDKKVVLLNNL